MSLSITSHNSGGELDSIFERDYCCAWRHGIWKYWIRQIHQVWQNSYFCIYLSDSYHIRSWRNGLLLSFKQFFGKKNYVHIYHMSYHRILRHKITTVHIVTRCLISTLKSTTTSDYRQRIRIGQVLTITRKLNGSHSWTNSPHNDKTEGVESGHRRHHISYPQAGRNFGLLRLTYSTHNTNIPGEERTFITTGRVIFTCLALLLQSGRRIWNQSAAGPLPNSHSAAQLQ